MRAQQARDQAAELLEQSRAIRERARTSVGLCLAIRDRIADMAWNLDLHTRNASLADHLAETRRRYAATLGRALEIEQAAGIISRRYGCSPTDAFALMRGVSQRTNRKLAVVAQSIVEQDSTGAVARKVVG